jgi:aminopeptidase N
MDLNRWMVLLAAGLWGLVFLAGCAGPGLRVKGAAPLSPNTIVELETGQVISLPELVERLADDRVVFIGEYHNHPQQHKNQLDLIKALHAQQPNLVVGLEIFDRDRQKLLDDWAEGRMDEKALKAAVLGRVLGGDTFMVYWPLLKWAGENQVKMLALNAPRKIVSRVAMQGLDALTPEEREQIAQDIEIGPDEYRNRVETAFKGHTGHVNLDNFFTAQVVWDETMSETLADYLQSNEGQNMRAVVIAGNEHVFRGYGVPNRTYRRMNEPQTAILAPVTTDDETLTADDADYIWITEPYVPPKRPRLGVELDKDQEGRTIVKSLVKGSEAERIGLAAGDVLVKLNGKEITSFMDLHKAAVQGDVDKEHELEVDRNGEILTFHFRFRLSSE